MKQLGQEIKQYNKVSSEGTEAHIHRFGEAWSLIRQKLGPSTHASARIGAEERAGCIDNIAGPKRFHLAR